jgi:hypothetical protein
MVCSPLGGKTAMNHQFTASHIRSLIRREVEYPLADFVRSCEALEQATRGERTLYSFFTTVLRHKLLPEGCGFPHLGFDVSWMYGVDPNRIIVLSTFQRNGFGEQT